TNWAHYHIASEPLAPGRVGAGLPPNVSNKYHKLQEYNNEYIYHTLAGRIDFSYKKINQPTKYFWCIYRWWPYK
ncbi:hypothetical protein, partial [Enterobacter intestinihominis]